MIAAFAASVVLTLSSTCYTPESSGSRMADGSPTSFGSVAMNILPLESEIKVVKPKNGFFGRTIFVVRDRIGYGSQLDFWTPSESDCIDHWGRKTVEIQVIRRGPAKRR